MFSKSTQTTLKTTLLTSSLETMTFKVAIPVNSKSQENISVQDGPKILIHETSLPIHWNILYIEIRNKFSYEIMFATALIISKFAGIRGISLKRSAITTVKHISDFETS